MLSNYIPVIVMLVVAAVVAIGMVAGSALLGPKHPTKYKDTPYECGITPVGSARERFPIKFYLVAMLFIIFDIETIFLYPWAVIYAKQNHADRIFLLGEMAVFVAILFVGYFYVLGKGALDWDDRELPNEGMPPAIWKSRPPIRFGNENSGPVQVGRKQELPDTGNAAADQNTAVHTGEPVGAR